MSRKRSPASAVLEGRPVNQFGARSTIHGNIAALRSGRIARVAPYLARAPLVLVVTIPAAIPVFYFTTPPRLFNGIAPPWQISEDLPQFSDLLPRGRYQKR